MKRFPTAESVIAAVNETIAKYHEVVTDKDFSDEFKQIVRKNAVAHIKSLGFSEGDAQRWLSTDPKRKRP